MDSWDHFVNYLHPGIESRVCDVTDLSFLEASSVNFVFASNLFEHISQDDFAFRTSPAQKRTGPQRNA